MRILTLLAVMAITAGQAWAEAPTYGKIHYTQGGTDGGRLCFSTTLDMTYNAQTDFNSSQVSSGNDWINTYTVTGKTLTDGKVYVRALPSFGYTVTGMTITVEPSAPSSTAEAPRRGAPGVASTIPVTPVEGHSGVYTFPMPTDGTNVTVTASFPVSTPINVDYLDATGTKKTAQAYVLDGAELFLGKSDQETWYVCNSNLDYNHILNIKGDIHLILADGAEMSVTSTDTNYGYAVGTNSSSIAIYGQTLGTGMLSAIGKDHGIFASNGNVTINHCKVTATGSSYGIYANPWDSNCGVTINGSEVSATSTLGNGIHAGYITISNSKVTANGKSDGFFAAAQSVSITGGEVNVTGSSEGIYAKSNITINNCETKVQGNYGLHTGGGNISITGGTLTATSPKDNGEAVCTSGSGTITLSNCTANVTGANGLYANNNNVSITGGELTATCKLGIRGNVTLNGTKVTLDCTEGTTGIQGNSCSITNNAIVNVTAKEEGIVIWGPFTMDSGQLTTTATSTGTNVHGLRAYTVTITGGQVTATGATYGILATSGDITLGWTNPTDYIKVNQFYSSNKVKVAAGKRFIAYNMASADDISASWFIGDATSTTATTIPDYVSLTDANAARTIAGKTLRPLDGYVVEDMAGLAFSGKMAPDFTMSCPFYIYKEDDEVTITTKNYGQNGIEFNTNPYDPIGEITAAPGTVLQTATFDMPPCDFTINYVKYYNTDVKYMDWDDTQKKLVEKKTDANTKVYILTGGGATNLDGGWYVANNWNTDATDGTDAAYTGKVTFDDDAHLILADGAEMSITPSSGHGIQSCGDIAIYSQSIGTDMGLLTITTSLNYNAIYTNDNADGDVSITINGGNINTTTNGISPVIYSAANNGTANVTINGGKVNTVNHTDLNGRGISAASFNSVADVTIRGGEVSISTYTDGICTRSNNGTANITISGGQVSCITEAEPGIKASTDFDTANINLSLTNGTDFIKATSYYANSVSGTASVRIPASKALFIDGTETVLGNTDADYVFGDGTNKTLDDIANQTLRPSKNVPVATGEQYDGIYQELGTWKNTDPNTKSYVPTGNVLQDGNGNYAMEVEEVTGDAAGTIPNGTPIILGNVNGLPANINMIGTSQAEATAIENGYAATEDAIEQEHQQEHTEPVITMLGTNTTETLEKQIARAVGTTLEVARADYMTLGFMGGRIRPLRVNMNLVPHGRIVLFTVSKLHVVHMIRGTYHGKKANSNAPTFGIPLDLGEEATGIVSMHNSQCIMHNDGWYTIDGRKLNGKPAAKGVYIYQGSKVVIK